MSAYDIHVLVYNYGFQSNHDCEHYLPRYSKVVLNYIYASDLNIINFKQKSCISKTNSLDGL